MQGRQHFDAQFIAMHTEFPPYYRNESVLIADNSVDVETPVRYTAFVGAHSPTAGTIPNTPLYPLREATGGLLTAQGCVDGPLLIGDDRNHRRSPEALASCKASSLSASSPTMRTNAVSRSSVCCASWSSAGVPVARIMPRWMIATRSHNRSTSSIR